MTRQEKKAFRLTKPWSNFRQRMRKRCGCKDMITGKELTRTWNLHHLDMKGENYTDLSNPDKFVPMNKDTHEFIHWLFRFYRHDRYILVRIQRVMDLMLLYNPPRVRHNVEDDE